MSVSTPITIIGNLTRDPELRFTNTGVAVARVSVAVTPRKYDRNTGRWADGDTTFWACTAWRRLAENIAESLAKGNRVVVTGTVRTERWTDTKTGQARERIVMEVDDIGPSLTFATATPVKAQGNGRPSTPADDPWAVDPGGDQPGPSNPDVPF